MKLHNRKPIVDKSKKRLGRGYASGKGGHTSSRGQKGQKSRTSIPAHFVGSSWVWFKRLPFIRGKSLFNPIKESVTITLTDLNRLKAGSKVNATTLKDAGIISKSQAVSGLLKLVNTGKLEKKLIVNIPASGSAVEAIKKAGGEYSVQTK